MEIITNVLISVFGFHFISLLLCISVVADFCYFVVFIDYTTVKKNYPFFYPCDSEILCQWITTFLFIFYARLVFFLSFRSNIQAVAPWFTYVENREAKDPFYTRIPIYITPIQLQRHTNSFRSTFPPKLQLQGSPFQFIYESIYIQGTRMN